MNLKKIDVNPVRLNNTVSISQVSESNAGVLVPIAPLTTVVGLSDGNGSVSMFFRIVVFIDSKNTIPPTFEFDEDRKTDFYVSFTLSPNIPQEYTAWYIEALFPGNSYETITVYTYNTDPRTSRGTVTVVSHEVPELPGC